MPSSPAGLGRQGNFERGPAVATFGAEPQNHKPWGDAELKQ